MSRGEPVAVITDIHARGQFAITPDTRRAVIVPGVRGCVGSEGMGTRLSWDVAVVAGGH